MIKVKCPNCGEVYSFEGKFKDCPKCGAKCASLGNERFDWTYIISLERFRKINPDFKSNNYKYDFYHRVGHTSMELFIICKHNVICYAFTYEYNKGVPVDEWVNCSLFLKELANTNKELHELCLYYLDDVKNYTNPYLIEDRNIQLYEMDKASKLIPKLNRPIMGHDVASCRLSYIKENKISVNCSVVYDSISLNDDENDGLCGTILKIFDNGCVLIGMHNYVICRSALQCTPYDVYIKTDNATKIRKKFCEKLNIKIGDFFIFTDPSESLKDKPRLVEILAIDDFYNVCACQNYMAYYISPAFLSKVDNEVALKKSNSFVK